MLLGRNRPEIVYLLGLINRLNWPNHGLVLGLLDRRAAWGSVAVVVNRRRRWIDGESLGCKDFNRYLYRLGSVDWYSNLHGLGLLDDLVTLVDYSGGDWIGYRD